MTAKSLNKIKFLLIALLFVFMATVFCFTDFARADDFLISELSLAMEKDAKYFHDEKSGKFGMQFTATLSDDDYNALKSQLKTGAYEDLEYGVIILPKYYTEIYPVNQQTVFSNTAVYDYANHDGYTWVYSGDKIRVININANDWIDQGNFYTYSGAIVDIKDGSEKYGYVNNLDLEMYAVSYVKATLSGGTNEYKFSEPVISSATYMAQKQIESGKFDDKTNAFLKENFIDKVQNKFSYTTEYYVQVDGGYVLFDKTVSDKVYSLGDMVVADKQDAIATGFVFDKENKNNILTAPVYANDLTTLKVYYSLDTEDGLIDVSKNKTFDFEYIKNLSDKVETFKLYKTIGNYDTELKYTAGSTLDLSTFNGTYRFSGGRVEEYDDKGTIKKKYVEYVGITFDCYNSNSPIEFTNVVDATSNAWGNAGARHVATRPFVMGWGVDWNLASTSSVPDGASATADQYFYTTTERYNNSTTSLTYAIQRLYIRPIHSKAYYEKFLNENYSLKFEYFFKNTDVSGTRQVKLLDGAYQTKELNKWYKGEIPISEILKNWDYITCPVSNTTGSEGALLTIKEDKLTINYEIFFGDIKFEDSRIADDLTERMIDVAGRTSYDVHEFLTEGVKSAINDYSQTHQIKYILSSNGNSIELEDGIAYFTDGENLRKFRLMIKADDLVIYSGLVDFYDSTRPYEWNEITPYDLTLKSSPYSAGESTISGDKEYTLIDTDTAKDGDVLYGRNGVYLNFKNTTAENVVMNLSPKHFEKYYDELYGRGYVLTFDYYVTNSIVARYVGTANYENAFKTWRGQLAKSKWGTVSISFDNFILQDDATESGYWYNFKGNCKTDSVSDRLAVFELPENTETYIGNFRIELMPEHIAYNTARKEIDVNGRPTFDLLNLLTETQKIKYETYTNRYGSLITWTLTFSDKTTTTFLAGQTEFIINQYLEKISNDAVNISAKISARAPDGVNRVYTVITLSNRTFVNFTSEVQTKLTSVSSNTEILQNIDHYFTGDLTENNGINLTVAKNETESAQIIITPYSDVGYYNVELLDLRDGSNYLKAQNFKAYHTHYVEIKKAMGQYYPYATGMYPDALIPMESAISNQINSIKLGENQGVWVQFTIPKDQPAGTYTGEIKVCLEESVYLVPVTINVVDYAIDDNQALRNNFGLGVTNIKHLEGLSNLTKEELRDYANANYYEPLLEYGINLGSFYMANDERWAGTYWVGRPYNPDAILSFEQIYVDGGYHYQYEYPLVSLGENDALVVWTGGFKNGYGINQVKVDEWVELASKYALNPKVTRYQLPVITGASVNFTKESLDVLYPDGELGYGNYTEARRDMKDGYRINSVNLLTTRDVYEEIFLQSVERGIDLFEKGDLFYSWIDEYSNTPAKLEVALIITRAMKDFFPDLAEWLKIKHNITDEFALKVLDSISKIQITSTGENTYDFDPETHWLAHCPSDGQYNSEKRRQEILEWANSVYDGEGRVWTYNGGYKIEDPATTIKSRGWWMYDYDVKADLQWAIMVAQYLDGINKTLVGKEVNAGDYIDPNDFYEIAVHYNSMSGIGYMLYPGSVYGVTGFVPSIRLDSYRDAVEEYQMLFELEKYYEKRANDKGLEYDGSGFDSIMDRLTEKMYEGTKYKTQNGYQDGYVSSRTSLVNMLALAKNHGIIVEKCTTNEEEVLVYVSTPQSVNLEGYTTKTTKDGFNEYTFTAGEKCAKISYQDLSVELSVEVYRETAQISHLEWTDGKNDTYKTYTNKTVNDTNHPIEVEKITLTVATPLGGVSDGDYYKVAVKNESDCASHVGFTLFSDHDKSYYEEFADITCLKFDVYIETTDANGNHPDGYCLYYSLGFSENRQQLMNEWFTIEIDMSLILERWDKVMATENDTEYRVTGGNLFTLGGKSQKTTYYIGNFRIEHN